MIDITRRSKQWRSPWTLIGALMGMLGPCLLGPFGLLLAFLVGAAIVEEEHHVQRR